MSVTAYLPVYRVAFAYQVKQGRSWTALEHMLLWRLAEGKVGTSVLAEEAGGIPTRLVIEALINMMQAGWVHLATSTEHLVFEASDLGKKVLKSRTLPPDTRVRRRGMTLLMDRLRSEFLVPEDVTLVHQDRIPTDAILLEPRAFKLTVDPASSLDRLDIREGEVFEQWIDYRVTSQFFYVQVTLVGNEIIGLPSYVTPVLRSELIQELGDAVPESSGAKPLADPTHVEGALQAVDIGSVDLVVGGSEHRAALVSMIERARSALIVHSCFLTEEGVKAILPALLDAAQRGIRVDLLWGVRQDGMDEKARRKLAAALAALNDIPKNLQSRVNIGAAETGSHAKIVIADSGPSGRYEAIVGSCNWLSTLYNKTEISLRISDQAMVGQLAALLAALRMPPSGRWSHDVQRLVAIRNICLAHPKAASANGQGRIVLDGEHLLAVRQARDHAENRIIAGCDIFGRAAEISVFVPMKGAEPTNKTMELFYSTPSSVVEGTEGTVEEELARAGILLKHRGDLHGKFLLWDDDDIVVTSFNWLATTADPWKPKGAEVGIHIRAPGIARKLMELAELHTSQGAPA